MIATKEKVEDYVEISCYVKWKNVTPIYVWKLSSTITVNGIDGYTYNDVEIRIAIGNENDNPNLEDEFQVVLDLNVAGNDEIYIESEKELASEGTVALGQDFYYEIISVKGTVTIN